MIHTLQGYSKKVDFLKGAGIIQGFISLYPNPTNNFIQRTDKEGFQTFDEYQNLNNYISEKVKSDMNFFSSMLTRKELGKIVSISAREKSDILMAEKFLSIIKK